MYADFLIFQLYRNYIEHHEEIITELESATRRNKRFEQILKEFESQKVCYLPLNTFLLKPAQRLLHYKLILERKYLHNHETGLDLCNCYMIINDGDITVGQAGGALSSKEEGGWVKENKWCYLKLLVNPSLMCLRILEGIESHLPFRLLQYSRKWLK